MASSTAAVFMAGSVATGRVFGANDRMNVAVIGVNGRGGSHIDGFGGKSDSDVVTLCDPDSKALARRSKQVEKLSGNAPTLTADIREVLQDDSIDAISIATPNHWHSLAAIWGLQAGKHVYVEKPLSHNVWEGRQLAELAKQSDKVCMHGTQSRSDATWLRDINLMHSGFIGKLHMAKGFTYKTGNRVAIGHREPGQAVPENLDWTLWQGPSKDHDYSSNYVHYTWHWYWEYGNGETGNQGVHQMDIAAWGLNRGLPTGVYSAGGRYHWDDDAETPNTQISTFTYEDGATLVFEVRNYGSYEEAGSLTTGNTFWGADGYYVQGKGFFDKKHNPIPIPEEVDVPDTKGNWQNFTNSVLHGAHNFAPAEAGHEACVHCHLGNTAYRLQRSLEFDPKTETFKGDKEANKMLSRQYRKGFEVPKIV